MSSTKNYTGATPSDFTYDSDKIEIVNNEFKLKLNDYPNQHFTEDFSSATGFTVPATAEFSGGQLQQVDQMPANGRMWVPFTNDADGTAGDGTLTGTLVNGASVSNGKLDLSTGDLNNSKYARWNGVGKVRAQRGAVKFKYTVKKEIPDNDITFFEIGVDGSFNDQLFLVWQTTRAIRVSSRTSTGGVLQSLVPFGSWFPTVGQEYEICYNWNFDGGAGNGVHQVYIDGVQQGGTQTHAGTRSDDLTSSDYLGIGNPYWTNQLVDDFIIFDEPHVTAPYTPGYSIAEYRYQESYTLSPVETASGSPDGDLQSIDNFSAGTTGDVRFTINMPGGSAFYWNNNQITVSDTSYAQSSPEADIIDLLHAFTVHGNTFQYGVSFSNTNTTQASITSLDVEYTHQIYPTDDPVISIANGSRIWVEAISEFNETVTKPANTDIQYIMVRQGSKLYWDSAAWSAATAGLWATSNSASDVETNLLALVPADSRLQIGTDIIMRSTDGMYSPTQSLLQFVYNEGLADVDPRLIDINGFLYKRCCPHVGFTVQVRPYEKGVANPAQGVFNTYEFEDLGTINVDGYLSGSVMLLPSGHAWEFKLPKEKQFAIIPDQDTVDFATLTFTKVED